MDITWKGLSEAFGYSIAVVLIVLVFGSALYAIGKYGVPNDPCNGYLQYATLQQIKDCGLFVPTPQ